MFPGASSPFPLAFPLPRHLSGLPFPQTVHNRWIDTREPLPWASSTNHPMNPACSEEQGGGGGLGRTGTGVPAPECVQRRPGSGRRRHRSPVRALQPQDSPFSWMKNVGGGGKPPAPTSPLSETMGRATNGWKDVRVMGVREAHANSPSLADPPITACSMGIMCVGVGCTQRLPLRPGLAAGHRPHDCAHTHGSFSATLPMIRGGGDFGGRRLATSCGAFRVSNWPQDSHTKSRGFREIGTCG